VIVAMLAIAIAAFLSLKKAPADIFPKLGVPVVYVVQPYGGMSPTQMETQLINYYEYHFLYLNGIEHIESESIQGMGMVKLYFRPEIAPLDAAFPWRRQPVQPLDMAAFHEGRRVQAARTRVNAAASGGAFRGLKSRAVPRSRARSPRKLLALPRSASRSQFPALRTKRHADASAAMRPRFAARAT